MKLRRKSIAIDDDVWNKIAAMATAHERSISQYIRLVLRKHLRELGITLQNDEKE